MKIDLQCSKCIRRQTAAVLDLTGAGEDTRNAVGVWLEVLLHCLPNDLPPSFIGRMIQRRIEDLTGVRDPYRALKANTNRFAQDLAARIHASIASSTEPIRYALRLSAAANIIDYGVKRSLTEQETRTALLDASSTPLHGNCEDEVVHKLSTAKKVLIIADNAGEIVFDSLLCELLPCRPTVAVRSAPVINDVTVRDALEIGLDKVADIVETGSDLPGLYYPYSSHELLGIMSAADVVISKGQGNYEGLSDTNFDGYFLFRVKCHTVSSHSGFGIGRNILIRAKGPLQ